MAPDHLREPRVRGGLEHGVDDGGLALVDRSSFDGMKERNCVALGVQVRRLEQSCLPSEQWVCSLMAI